MNKFPLIATEALLWFFTSCITNSSKTVNTKGDLRKLNWIEGNWKGMDGNSPFYEIYKIINDTTLEITSYDWTEKTAQTHQ